MDLSAFATSLQNTLGEHIPAIFGALAILVLGWMIAVAARAAVRTLLSMARLNGRIAESTGQKIDLEGQFAIGFFWVVLLIAAVAAFNVLDLQMLSQPFTALIDKLIGYLPKLLAGTLLIVLAWFVATVVRKFAAKALAATVLDDKLSSSAGMEPMSQNLANVLFWLVILLFLPAVLSAFEVRGLLEPVQAMLVKALDMVPNVFAALVIGVVGWLVAKLLRALVTNLLGAAGVDRLGESAGVGKTVSLSRLTGTLVFIFVFVPSLIAALDALQMKAISAPATEMLNRILEAVPNLLAAAAILAITYYVARFGADLLERLLTGMSFNKLPEKLGFGHVFDAQLTPSRLAGRVALFFAMLFATVEAANRLGFEQVRDVVTAFVRFGGDVLLGGVILVVGFWLANIVHEAVKRASGEKAAGLAGIARIAIVGLVIAMGLRAMGIADDIVNLAFGLTLGAVAVAVALSFGLGGREAAGRQMEHWLSRLREKN